jgi:hypothetical protein
MAVVTMRGSATAKDVSSVRGVYVERERLLNRRHAGADLSSRVPKCTDDVAGRESHSLERRFHDRGRNDPWPDNHASRSRHAGERRVLATHHHKRIASRRNAARPEAADTLRTRRTRTNSLRRAEPPKPRGRALVSACTNSRNDRESDAHSSGLPRPCHTRRTIGRH